MNVLSPLSVAAAAEGRLAPAELADRALARVEARYGAQLTAIATLVEQLRGMRELLGRQLGQG